MTELLAEVGRYGLSLCWQLTVVVALAWTLAAVLGERWASCRYRLWLLVLTRLYIPVVLVTPIGLLSQDAPPGMTAGAAPLRLPAPAAETTGGPSPATQPADGMRRTSPPYSMGALLTLGWLGGVVGLSWVVIRRHRRLLREVEAAPAATGPLSEFVERSRRELGLRHPVRVRLMPAAATTSGPALVGLLEPVVVVPDHFAAGWCEGLHGPLLLHELVHLERRDHWLNLAVTAVRVLYFFHPAVWVATSRLLRERERVCDDAVVRHLGPSARLYVRALCHHGLSLSSGQTSALTVPLTRRRADLVRRVDRLVDTDRREAGTLAALVVVGLGALVLAVAADRTGTFRGEPTEAASPTSPALERLARELESAYGDLDRKNEAATIALELARSHPTMPEAVGEISAQALDRSAEESAARRVWLGHLQSRPDDVAILRNAARFFRWTDEDEAEVLLERGRSLRPADWWWPTQLAELRQNRAAGEPPDRSRATLERARANIASALDLAPPAVARVRLLERAARIALATGRIDEAEALARRELAEAPALAGTWYHGNALHGGRLTLGEVALVRGDLDGAARWLIAAADVPGSPQLTASGPSTALAEKLLERGMTGPVLRYLEAWKGVWKYERGRLDAWAADIRVGANRVYQL